MTNKHTKRALFSSVLALILCCAMLVGTTFAWFTDSVQSGNNQIVAGNLDVELYRGATKDKVDANTKLFDGIKLWEPGVVAYENLTVANVGNLALKYELSINFGGENYVVDNGTQYSLADVLKVALIPGGVTGTTREAVLAEVVANNGGVALKSFAQTGDLEPKATGDAFGLVIYWEPGDNAFDNLFNMNNGKTTSDGKPLHIDLGVKLLATQLPYEEDSFGPDYDADAVLGNYVELNAGEDILAVLANAEPGMPLTIKLLGDIEWPTPAKNASDITPASSVVILGNGNTITAIGNGVYAIGDNDAPITFKDLTVVDKSYYTYEDGENAWEFTYLELAGNNTYENVKFTDGIMVQGGNNTFVNCQFEGHNNDSSDLGNVTMNGVWMYDGNATFTNCTFTGTRGMKICDMYSGGEVGTVVIDGCTFNGLTEKPGVAIDDEDTQDMKITIKNSTFINCQPGDQGLYIYETDNTVPTLENNTVINGAISSGRIEYAGDRYQIAADFAVTGVKTLEVEILDQNGNMLTTITPEGYEIPDNGNIGDPTDKTQNSWNTACAAITGNSSSWKHTPFVPTLDAVPTKMVLVVNDLKVAECGISQDSYPYGKTWEEVVTATTKDAANDAELDEAIKAGAMTINLGNGNYIIPDSAKGKTLAIIGNGNTVIATQDDGTYEGCDYSLEGATVTFEKVTINTDSTTYTGYARLNATYNNCTINGTYTLYGDSVFNNCELNVSGDAYNIWTWGAPNATFNDCTFNSDGKALLLYGTVNTNLTVNDCVFNDKGGLTDLKAAIEIGDDYGKSYTLTVNNTVVNGYEINDKGINTGSTLWANKNSMTTDKLNVIIDGVDVY